MTGAAGGGAGAETKTETRREGAMVGVMKEKERSRRRSRSRDKDRDKERRGDGSGDEREGAQEEESSDENLDIEINSEDSDEDAIIERKRKERAELLAKLAAGGPTEAMQHREKVKRPLTPPEVKISKTVKDELREDMVARQVGMMEKQLEASVGHKLEKENREKNGKSKRSLGSGRQVRQRLLKMILLLASSLKRLEIAPRLPPTREWTCFQKTCSPMNTAARQACRR